MPRPLSRPHPLYPSLLVLAEHVVLFALHVFKVKVAPSHAFVDVLDVITSGLKVGGGIVGTRGKDLGKKKSCSNLPFYFKGVQTRAGMLSSG